MRQLILTQLQKIKLQQDDFTRALWADFCIWDWHLEISYKHISNSIFENMPDNVLLRVYEEVVSLLATHGIPTPSIDGADMKITK